ncbi:MAG: N-acetyltransferase [Acidimicrobiia bacterium]|nr:N-acetyltransferase [Acidimicrobiia bacterium]
MTETSVRRDEERCRYELVEDGVVVGHAAFRGLNGVVVMPHTEIDPRRRGTGLGAKLVQGALDDLRQRGSKVVPSCWYVAEFIDGHPDYADLLAD